MYRIYVYKYIYIYKMYIYIRFIWPQSSLNSIKQISEERPVRPAAPRRADGHRHSTSHSPVRAS